MQHTEDHPRLRGEKSCVRKSRIARLGSPPLTRGKGYVVRSMTDTIGITPAYAGKRHRCLPPQRASRDHPRLRGEKKWTRSCGCRW